MRLLACTLVLLLSVPVVGACGVEDDCTGTETSASDASRVDLDAENESSVLRGRLEADGKGLAGQPIVLTLHAEDDDTVFTADLRSTTAGRIVYDLRGRLDAATLDALSTATSYDLDFDGDETYCSSSDTGDFRTVDS